MYEHFKYFKTIIKVKDSEPEGMSLIVSEAIICLAMCLSENNFFG